ncbi:MAG: exo-alpha-sialidase, partial [Clostridia bacterium]|nr:exo-alpha-sialidase [Clostridia bacterium]
RDGIGQAFSSDDGATWENIGFSGHTGPNSRFFIRRLRSGRILLVNHVNPTYLTDPKDWNVRNNLMAMLSEDDGKTWIGGLMLDTRTGISYPDGVEDEEGRIYIVYDHDRTGAREILMAEFTEEDILEGRAASGAARLRVLINRAEGEKP